jgi:hypothetical protein
VPPINRNFDGIEDELAKLGCGRWERIQAILTWPVIHHLLCFLVLNQEEIVVKLNKCVTIKGKIMGKNIFYW